MSAESLPDLGVREVAAGYRARRFSPVEVTTAVLARIEQTEPRLHAWVEIAAGDALEAAAEAERELMSGVDRGLLHGIPIGVKDIFDVAGFPTRCGSAARSAVEPASQDARTVAAARAGGAVILGKTVTQEFAAGVISAPARNPWNPERAPGGSSGGSAAAVAAGGCYVAFGSDTGGSIRIPAAACGVVGYKPEFGRLDLAGVYPLSWSLDTAGPIARSVDDAEIFYRILSVEPTAPAAGDQSLHQFRIGVCRNYFFDSLQPDVAAAVELAIEKLGTAGAVIVDAPWAKAAAARACSFLINRIETAVVHENVARQRPEEFAAYGPELRVRVAAGLGIPASVYLQAVRARPRIRDSMAQLFADHSLDALLVPTLPTTAVAAIEPRITGTGLDESVGAGWTRLTMPFNATGQPVLAIPCGLDSNRLPVGLQLAGAPGREHALFAIGRLCEAVLSVPRPALPIGHDQSPAA
ncbi:MAG: amidase [Thermomicrobiales bacterium]